MSHELREGTQLRTIRWPHGAELRTGTDSDCFRIVVSEQPGQMGMVPWAKADYRDGTTMLWNLDQVSGVELEPAQ